MLHIAVENGQTRVVLGFPDHLGFLGRAQKNLLSRGAAIFTYHKIGPPPRGCRDPFLYTPEAAFDHQLSALREAGYRSQRLDEIFPFPASAVGTFAVTFDDGFRNVLERGVEVLARHQVSAIQFIVSGFIGRQNAWDMAKGDSAEALMDVGQIKEWLAAGHAIGSHSVTHPNLKQVSLADAREEIFSSKKALEDTFGVEVRHFSYPFGGWTPAVRDLLAEAGYRTACTVEFGVNNSATDPWALRRIIPLGQGELVRKIIHRLARRF